MKYVIPFMFLAILAPPAQARPVLLELFTSQSCSSCPPAEALLANLKSTRPDVNVLEFHVDYWNALNWHDPYSSRAATNRQRAYAAALATEVFTPQLVIDGHRSEIGSDQASVAAAIATAQHAQAAGPPLSVSRTGAGIAVSVGPGSGAMPEAAQLLLIGYDPSHTTAIPSGENGGSVLTEVNVVRSLQQIGTWRGVPIGLTVPPPPGALSGVILQGANGTILASAFPAP